MKSRFLAPVMLVVFLAGTAVALGQDQNQKKIERIQRKIEKQHKKLQELTGEQYHAYAMVAPPMSPEQIVKIKTESKVQMEKAREEMREAMDEQREAMQDQREAMQDQKREMEKQMLIIRDKKAKESAEIYGWDLGELKELEDKNELELEAFSDLNGKKFKYYYKSPNWHGSNGETIVIGDNENLKLNIPEFKGQYYSFGNLNQDNLSINKELTEETSAADFNYEVKPGVKKLSVMVSGSIDAGKVKITINKPNGEVYNEYTLSPLANVNWNQTISFEDQEETQYVGKWTVSVSAEKAKGKYNVCLSGF